MRKSTIKLLVLLLATATLGACSSTTDPALYFLDGNYEAANDSDSKRAVGLAEVTLPEYARKDKISSIIGRNRIIQSDEHQWAESPEDAVAQALARTLETVLSTSVLRRPYPRGIEPQQQILITFNRFLRGEIGEAQLSGRYIVLSTQRGVAPILRRFSYKIPSDSTNYEDFVSAVLLGLRQLSDDISISLADN